MSKQTNLPALRDEQQVQNYAGPDLRVTLLTQLSDPATPMEIRKDILAMMERLETRYAEQQYVTAFYEAKKQLDGFKIRKRGEIIYPAKEGKSRSVVKFAKYDDIADVIKPILHECGLTAAYTYEYTTAPPKIICVMRLTHISGHREEFRSVPMPMVDTGGGKNDVQGAGSVGSYGRRYVVCPAFDIVTEDEDDDGSGKGVSERITEEQAHRIEDILSECDNRKPGTSAKFIQWIKAEMRTDNIAELFQGLQFDSVMSMLRQKMASLGVK